MIENQFYDEPEWETMENDLADDMEMEVVKSDFIQNTTFLSDMSGDMSYEE